jgi:uncharacterized protein (DUF2237 family)
MFNNFYLKGYNRKGRCENDPTDEGTHLICARVTNLFLKFSQTKGNDLITPNKYFPGLKEGDYWCLCVFRWYQAYNDINAGNMSLNLAATNLDALKILVKFNVTLDDLRRFQSQKV